MTADEARKKLFSMMREDECHAKTLVNHYADQFESLRQKTSLMRKDEFMQELDGRAEVTAEQQARDMLDRMGIDGAQSFSSGELVELANLLNFSQLLTKKNAELGVKVVDGTIAARRISDENEKLRAFAQAIMEAWPDGGIEGGDLQEIAHRHGLLALELRYEPCGEWCNCNDGVDVDGGEWERGVECYRRTALLMGESE